MRQLADDLKLAFHLADTADAISLRCFGRGDPPTIKDDNSPVTAADLEIEQQLESIIRTQRPSDAVFGEELAGCEGEITVTAPTWLIDPIDHTRHFTRGDPNYGVLITLIVDGHASAAVVSAPSLGLRWSAVRGGGAMLNGQRMSVSTISDLRGAHLALAGHREWVQQHDWVRVVRLMNQVGYLCGTPGGFLPAMQVASAQLDAFAEPWGAIWDHAALALIVEEAGGRASTLSGAAPSGGSLLVSNGVLHDALLEYLSRTSQNAEVPNETRN